MTRKNYGEATTPVCPVLETGMSVGVNNFSACYLQLLHCHVQYHVTKQ